MPFTLAIKPACLAAPSWVAAVAPLPKAPPAVQWRLLGAAFAPMHRRATPMLMPAVGALAVVACGGTLWLLACAVATVALRALFGGAAHGMELRAADTPVAAWAARFVACAWLEAAVLGVAGGLSVARGEAEAGALMLAPLALAAMHAADTAVFRRVAWGQITLLIAPLAVVMACAGSPAGLALALVGVGLAGCACTQAAEACTRAGDAAGGLAVGLAVGLAGGPALALSHVPAEAVSFQEAFGRDIATGLPNQPRFSHLLAQESQRAVQGGAPLSLIMLHCDRFVADPGRVETAEIARRLQHVLWRPGDALASFGGGRFGVLLPFTDALGCATVAEKLRAALRDEPACADDGEAPWATKLSIGTASYAGQGMLLPSALMDRADAALMRARKDGGDKVCRDDPAGAAAMRPAARRVVAAS
jgi:diguanylate cyclase (GGDEF)-like protein